MGLEFDGPNKKIRLTVGTTYVEVADMYSRWVDWFLTDDNSKFFPAMRNVGGDAVSDTKDLGVTFFLVNGWRIVPQAADHRLILNGNLYTDPAGSSPIDTVIGYSIIVEYSVSNLVDSTFAQMSEVQHIAFNNCVTLDTINGATGTAYPIGTPIHPVKTLADAKVILASRGFDTIHLLSPLTIHTGESVDSLFIESDDWSKVTIEEGASSDDTCFTKVSIVDAVMSGYWNVLIDCWIYNMTNFCGWIRGGSIENVELAVGDLGEEFGSQTFFDDLVPMYPGIESTLKMNESVTVSITNCKDICRITSMVAGTTLHAGLLEGVLTIDASCTGGVISISGVGVIHNNSELVIDDEALSRQSIADAVSEAPVIAKEATVQAISGEIAMLPDLLEIEASSVLAKEATSQLISSEVLTHPTLAEIEASSILAKQTDLLRALGLMQENQYLDNNVYTTYNGVKLLTSSRIRTYSNPVAVGTDNDVLATYLITATWNNDQLQSYKVMRQ